VAERSGLLNRRTEVLSRSEAMILERKIKKRGAKRFLDNHIGV